MRALDLHDPDAVIAAFRRGTDANRSASCRKGSIDLITAPGRLLATGDLHDNPLHLARLVKAAGLDGDALPSTASSHSVSPSLRPSVPSPSHLVLHEIIHSDRLFNGMDFSFRALARVAALKADHPELVHTLLANHELSQVKGAGIIKDGVRVVQAFDEGLDYAYADRAPEVRAAIGEFIYSMPLALRADCGVSGPGGDILCAHSIPGTALMGRFDASVLSRDLTEADYEPRQGAAHLMVWGRGYDAEQLEDLVERWGVNLFILGHEKAENGVQLVPPCAVVLNSDHERGVYLPIDLSHRPTAEEAVGMVVSLAESV
ncbi:MAG: hypothetical protein ACKVW3_07360 [Phycisphaerales bacterium]